MDHGAPQSRHGFADDYKFKLYSTEDLKSGTGQAVSGRKRRLHCQKANLPSGAYNLDDEVRPHGAQVHYEEKAVIISKEEFEELYQFGIKNVKPTRNPMNKSTYIRRLQGTFGSDYRFGNQHSRSIGGPDPTDWPEAVRIVLGDAKSRSSAPHTLTAVHTNWYPDGSAGLMPHADAEDKFIPGMPIYSYTLLSDPTLPRGFQIYRIPEEKVPLCEIKLGHGDLLIMAGDMQQRYKHGVKATSARAYRNLRRINMTVRSVKQ